MMILSMLVQLGQHRVHPKCNQLWDSCQSIFLQSSGAAVGRWSTQVFGHTANSIGTCYQQHSDRESSKTASGNKSTFCLCSSHCSATLLLWMGNMGAAGQKEMLATWGRCSCASKTHCFFMWQSQLEGKPGDRKQEWKLFQQIIDKAVVGAGEIIS